MYHMSIGCIDTSPSSKVSTRKYTNAHSPNWLHTLPQTQNQTVTHITTYRQSMAGHGACGGPDRKSCLDLRILHQDLQQRQQDLLNEVASLSYDLTKVA